MRYRDTLGDEKLRNDIVNYTAKELGGGKPQQELFSAAFILFVDVQYYPGRENAYQRKQDMTDRAENRKLKGKHCLDEKAAEREDDKIDDRQQESFLVTGSSRIVVQAADHCRSGRGF